ncbi:glycosyltransferase family 39 protein [Priestia megaterium]
MNKVKDHYLSLFFNKCLLIFCIFIFLGSLLSACLQVKQYLNIKDLHLVFYFAIMAVIFLGLSFIATKFMSKKIFIIFLIALSFLIRLVWILNIDTPIKSDFSVMYNAAVQAAKGDFSFTKIPYFSTWVYQLGFTFYEAAVIKIFGESALIIKLLNILYCTGTGFLIYLIASKVLNEKNGRIAGLLFALYIPNILFASVLTNQHIATFLFYLGFYILISGKWKLSWLYVGILFSLGNLMRPLGPIIIIAFIIYLFLSRFLSQNREQKVKAFKYMVGVLATFYIVNTLISTIFVQSSVTNYPLGNRDPLWKFVLGLNHESVGSYSQEDVNSVMSKPVGEEREKVEKALISERIEDKSQLLALFAQKFYVMWGDKDASISWSLSEYEGAQHTFIILERLVYIFSMLCGLIGLIYLTIKKQYDFPYSLFLLLIIGYVVVHLLIEIQTRYRYFLMPSIMVFQAFGFYIIGQFFMRKIRK